MKTMFVGMLCVVLFFTGCGSSIIAQNQMFSIGLNVLGIVNGNTVKFYEYDDEWEEDESATFKLPNGYKSVFGVGLNVIGVVVGNTVKFYEYDDEWEEDESAIFTIK